MIDVERLVRAPSATSTRLIFELASQLNGGRRSIS
jgi:hypothetical protein